jgi:hypothetical protein
LTPGAPARSITLTSKGCCNWWSEARIAAVCSPPRCRASKSAPDSARDRAGLRAAGTLDRRGKHLDHRLHAEVHVVVARVGEALAEGGVERIRRRTTRVRVPLGHRVDGADTGLADRRWDAERIAVEGEELAAGIDLARRLDQQRQVVAPVSGENRLRAAGPDLGRIGQEVLDAPHRMQLIAHDLDVRPLGAEHRPRLAQHVLAEAVVLANQVDLLDRSVGAQHLDQRRQTHVGVRVEAEVPGAAALVGQHRIDRRVVQEQHAALRIALVVAVDRLDQRRRRGRAVALGDEPDALVDGRAQQGDRLFRLAFAVETHQFQFARHAAHLDTAAAVDPLGGPHQVAEHRLAGVGERARQALDQRDPQRRIRRLRERGPAGGRGREHQRLAA